MKANKFTIEVGDNTSKMNFTTENPVNIEDWLQISGNVSLVMLKGLYEDHEQREDVAKELYNMYNIAASNVLSLFEDYTNNKCINKDELTIEELEALAPNPSNSNEQLSDSGDQQMY